MKVRRTLAISAVLALVLLAGLAISQKVANAAQPQGFGGGMDHHMLGMMTDYLGLSDAQQSQVKQIFANEKPTIQPLMEQVHQSHQQMMQLITSGNFDESKAREIASQQAQAETELAVERAKIHAQIFNLLTPDQKTKAVQFINNHEQRFEKHMQHMQQNQAPTQ